MAIPDVSPSNGIYEPTDESDAKRPLLSCENDTHIDEIPAEEDEGHERTLLVLYQREKDNVVIGEAGKGSWCHFGASSFP